MFSDVDQIFGWLKDYHDNQTNTLMDLIARLECVVGQNFKNQQERGSFSFRYPVRFVRDGQEMEGRGGVIPELKQEEFESVRYVMGANSLYIGRALFDVLKYLEYRYIGDLDFTELEQKYQRGYYKGKDDQIKDKLLGDMLKGFPMDHLFDIPSSDDE